VAVGKAKVKPGLRRMVQFVGRNVVTERVVAVVRKPQLLGDGVPIKANRVADAAGVDLNPLPSGRNRVIVPNSPMVSQTLHGAPTGT
jgi:hypothetical protein